MFVVSLIVVAVVIYFIIIIVFVVAIVIIVFVIIIAAVVVVVIEWRWRERKTEFVRWKTKLERKKKRTSNFAHCLWSVLKSDILCNLCFLLFIIRY